MSELFLAERKNDRLEQRLDTIKLREKGKARREEVDYEFCRGEVPMEPSTAVKIKVFQEEIEKLKIENLKFILDNTHMKERPKTGEDMIDETNSSSSDSSS